MGKFSLKIKTIFGVFLIFHFKSKDFNRPRFSNAVHFVESTTDLSSIFGSIYEFSGLMGKRKKQKSIQIMNELASRLRPDEGNEELLY